MKPIKNRALYYYSLVDFFTRLRTQVEWLPKQPNNYTKKIYIFRCLQVERNR